MARCRACVKAAAQARFAERKAAGQCVRCDDPAVTEVLCATHRDELARRAARRRHGAETAMLLSVASDNDAPCELCGVRASLTVTGELVVDHDHSCCPGQRSCARCVRGFVCGSCNTKVETPSRNRTFEFKRTRYLADAQRRLAVYDVAQVVIRERRAARAAVGAR